MKGNIILIDVAIQGDRDVIQKEAEILKYKDLTIQYNNTTPRLAEGIKADL
jgi:hypothetical protein